ncbi:MAG: LPS export ABC transporter permease LptF [Cellvibrionaceae bacterium]
MIILRYITREILTTTLVISGALVLFSVGGRFSKYLDQAWNGDFSPNVLFLVLAYRIPEFLTLILPISFFLGALMAFGRLYVDNEMVVLSSGGIGKGKILGHTLFSSGIIAIVVAALSIWIAPHYLAKTQNIFEEQSQRSELNVLAANRFQTLSDGKLMTYFQSFNESRTKINNVFIAEMSTDELSPSDTGQPVSDLKTVLSSADSAEQEQLFVITAKEGEEWNDPDTGRRYLLLHDGYQYVGKPGERNYQELKFETYGYYLQPRDVVRGRSVKLENLPLKRLLEVDHQAYKAEFHWRISLPIMVIIVTFIAVPMSHTNPRQGRFVKMLPAFFLFMSYLGLLVVAKGWVEEQKLSTSVGLWPIHGMYLCLGLALMWWNNGQPNGKMFNSRVSSEVGGERVTRDNHNA